MDQIKCKYCSSEIYKKEGSLIWMDNNPLDFLAIMCLTSPTKKHELETIDVVEQEESNES
jgi:hypothetical protein